ncbi:MAG: DNA-binding protein [Flavobacteriales bacterium]|nr:hypothetical protein [Flavobacteriales bacterium]MCB9448987.1 DNA-binding protein [Flavobacteriales bacterium]
MPTQIITLEDLMAVKEEILQQIQASRTPPEKAPQKWVKLNVLRKALGGISEGKIKALRNKGLLKWQKMGGTHLYDLEHAMNLMESDEANLDLKIES